MTEHEHPTERVAAAHPHNDLEDAVRSIEATGEDEWPRAAGSAGDVPDKAPDLDDESADDAD